MSLFDSICGNIVAISNILQDTKVCWSWKTHIWTQVQKLIGVTSQAGDYDIIILKR